MQEPTRFGHPDRVRSPRWHKGSSDDGGVHRNSGVGNKAAYLIAEGGRFRGIGIEGISRARAARVFYQALTSRLTPAANYIDLGDALNAACTDLAGTPDFSLAHCKSVRDATRATEMHLEPKRWAPRKAPLCGAGTVPVDVFYDDLENPASGRWGSLRLRGGKKGWYHPQNPNNSPSWDGTWASSGALNFYAPNRGSRSDSVMGTKAPYLLPPNAYLRFEHGYSFDKDSKRRYDGGVVEIKVDGGGWRSVPGRFSHGGYNGKIAAGRGNPLAGKRAFTGSSKGWSSARLDLSRLAGRWVKFRFRMASDKAVGGLGWYIDDVRLYVCANDADAPTGGLAIAGGVPTTGTSAVMLNFTYGDASTWVTHLRVAGSPELNAKGTLLHGLNMPIRDALAWDLADATYGGPAGPGLRAVYAQVRDAAGNWSAVFGDDIEWLPG